MKIIYLVLVCFIFSCNNAKLRGHGSTITLESKNENIKTSDIRIEVEGDPALPTITIWDGKQKEAIPAYGVEGVKWTINYKDSLYGEFVHGKIIMNQPLHYSFIFNRNSDSSFFVQVSIPQDFGKRIRLLPAGVH